MNQADMTISAYGRGPCPTCGRDVSLTEKGNVRRHSGNLWAKRAQPCIGSGQPAADAPAGAVLADNERLRAERAAWRSIGGAEELEAERDQLRQELAETRARLAAAETELNWRRGIRPCHRTIVHPGHLWMLDRQPVTCLGVKDEPRAEDDGGGRAADGPGRAQEARGGDNEAGVGNETGEATEGAREGAGDVDA